MVEKKGWVVRAEIAIGVDGNHPMHEFFTTRDEARGFKRLLKGMGNWESVQMYRSREITFENGSVNISMWPAR